jgi:hypothetical protein
MTWGWCRKLGRVVAEEGFFVIIWLLVSSSLLFVVTTTTIPHPFLYIPLFVKHPTLPLSPTSHH